MKKLLLCLILCFIVGIIPAFASTIAFPTQMVENTLFFMGTYENKPVSWILLGNSQEEAPLAVCQYVFPEQPFSSRGISDYAESELRRFLDGTFYETVFSDAEKKLIRDTGCPDTKVTDWLKPYPIPQAQGFYIFPLSATQVREVLGKYNSLSGISFTDGTAAGYWLRSAHQSIQNACGIVRSDNTISSDTVTDSHGIRPAFHMDFSPVIFVRKAVDEDYGTVGLVAETDFNRSGEYKFSLLSDTLSFSVSEVAYDPSGKISVTYDNASVQDDTYLSAIIVNHRGEICAYGRLGKAKRSAGRIVGTCQFDMTDADYTMQFFLETPGEGSMPDHVCRPVTRTLVYRNVTVPLPVWFWFIPGMAVLIIVVFVIRKKKNS